MKYILNYSYVIIFYIVLCTFEVGTEYIIMVKNFKEFTLAKQIQINLKLNTIKQLSYPTFNVNYLTVL